MSNNYTVTWLQSSLNRHAIGVAQDQIQATGRALPCQVVAVSGSIVTVSFEIASSIVQLQNITIPKAEGPWLRSPTQIGDYGITVPADAYLGAISGMGGGVATLTPRGNLSALVWVPVASTAFSAVNTNAAYVSGPDGAVIQTEDGSAVLTVNTSGITMTFGGKTVTLNSSGFMIDGILFETHEHSGVTTGTSNTGAPV